MPETCFLLGVLQDKTPCFFRIMNTTQIKLMKKKGYIVFSLTEFLAFWTDMATEGIISLACIMGQGVVSSLPRTMAMPLMPLLFLVTGRYFSQIRMMDLTRASFTPPSHFSGDFVCCPVLVLVLMHRLKNHRSELCFAVSSFILSIWLDLKILSCFLMSFLTL